MNDLRNRLGGRVAARHLNQTGRMHEAVGQLLDLIGEGRGEKQVLTLFGQQREHSADVMDKTHVQHAIGLIQHQDFHFGQIERFLTNMIEQPPRRCHQDIDTVAQGLNLRPDIDAAENYGGAQRQVPAVSGDAFADLGRQLTGGSKHQSAHRARATGRRTGVQALQQRQGEAGGLAGAGLGAGQDVTAFEYDGNGLGLDGCGLAVALIGYSSKQFGRKAEVVKRHKKYGLRDLNRPTDAFGKGTV